MVIARVQAQGIFPWACTRAIMVMAFLLSYIWRLKMFDMEALTTLGGHSVNMAYFGQQAAPGVDQNLLWGVFQK
jgi:hypothetical protein